MEGKPCNGKLIHIAAFRYSIRFFQIWLVTVNIIQMHLCVMSICW